MGENSIKERIELLIAALGVSTRQFSLTVSGSDSFARNIKENIGSDKISNILRMYPHVNPYWLIDGQDPMFIESSDIIMGNNISRSNITKSGTIDNSIKVEASGDYEKIINPNRTVEIHKAVSADKDQHIAILLDKINLMQSTIDSQKKTIETQQDIIDILRSKKD